jgi:hypothetical protein
MVTGRNWRPREELKLLFQLGQGARFLLLLERRNVRSNPTSSFKVRLIKSLACLVQLGVLWRALTAYKQSYQISINRIYNPENERQSLALAYTALKEEDSGMNWSRWQVGKYVGKEVQKTHKHVDSRQTDSQIDG